MWERGLHIYDTPEIPNNFLFFFTLFIYFLFYTGHEFSFLNKLGDCLFGLVVCLFFSYEYFYTDSIFYSPISLSNQTKKFSTLPTKYKRGKLKSFLFSHFSIDHFLIFYPLTFSSLQPNGPKKTYRINSFRKVCRKSKA